MEDEPAHGDRANMYIVDNQTQNENIDETFSPMKFGPTGRENIDETFSPIKL